MLQASRPPGEPNPSLLPLKMCLLLQPACFRNFSKKFFRYARFPDTLADNSSRKAIRERSREKVGSSGEDPVPDGGRGEGGHTSGQPPSGQAADGGGPEHPGGRRARRS